MNGGSKLLASAAVLALAGCGGSDAKLQIRATPAPLSATAKPVPARIAEANGHLALGNVALALESYRKALREQPDSVEAMLGLAACYDRMARFDLSRRYYETALAVVPADTGVLNAFARSLDTQGLAEEAAEVRREVAMRLAAAKVSPEPTPIQRANAVPPPKIAVQGETIAGPSVTVVLPASRPATAARTEPPAPRAVRTPVRETAAPIPSPKPIAAATAAASAQPLPVRPMAAARPAVPIGRSVTMALPAPKAIEAAPPLLERPRQEAVAAAPLPSAEPAPMMLAAPAQRRPASKASARLERLSPGEVALITTGRPQWRSQVVGRTAQSTTIRYVPLRTAQVRPVRLRLLNAARYQGLAARTRRLLATRGWRELAIGDATRVRRTSLILYPPNRRSTAERLAKQFGFPIAKRASGDEFVMFLGRDATMIAAARTEG